MAKLLTHLFDSHMVKVLWRKSSFGWREWPPREQHVKILRKLATIGVEVILTQARKHMLIRLTPICHRKYRMFSARKDFDLALFPAFAPTHLNDQTPIVRPHKHILHPEISQFFSAKPTRQAELNEWLPM